MHISLFSYFASFDGKELQREILYCFSISPAWREREDKESVRVKDREGKGPNRKEGRKEVCVCVRERVLTNNNYK